MECKICSQETENKMSIKLEEVFICYGCANQITQQQILSLIYTVNHYEAGFKSS